MYNFPQQPPYYYQPQYPQRQMEQNMQVPQNYLKGRPVVSIEEARAAQIDLDGSIHIFTDIGNKRIYTKQINLDGTATLNVYQLVEDSAPVGYITREEFEKVIQKLREELKPNQQIEIDRKSVV